jgi:hypothetical protein
MDTRSSAAWGGRRKFPNAFTEHGALMAASVLNSPSAVEMSILVVRAFVRELMEPQAKPGTRIGFRPDAEPGNP